MFIKKKFTLTYGSGQVNTSYWWLLVNLHTVPDAFNWFWNTAPSSDFNKTWHMLELWRGILLWNASHNVSSLQNLALERKFFMGFSYMYCSMTGAASGQQSTGTSNLIESTDLISIK